MEREKWENNDACIIMEQRIKETEKMKRGYYIARVFQFSFLTFALLIRWLKRDTLTR